MLGRRDFADRGRSGPGGLRSAAGRAVAAAHRRDLARGRGADPAVHARLAHPSAGVTPSAASRSRIVAVDGLDGSGKSQLAAALAAACAADGVSTTMLHVDDFRRDLDFGGLDAAAEAARYYERYYDLDALDARARVVPGGSDGRGGPRDRRGCLHAARADHRRVRGPGGAERERRRGPPEDPRARSGEGTHRRGDPAPHRPPLLPGAGPLPCRVRSRGPRRRHRRQRGLAPAARRPQHAGAVSRARSSAGWPVSREEPASSAGRVSSREG